MLEFWLYDPIAVMEEVPILSSPLDKGTILPETGDQVWISGDHYKVVARSFQYKDAEGNDKLRIYLEKLSKSSE